LTPDISNLIISKRFTKQEDKMRRVVTGIDKAGKSYFVSDGEPQRHYKAPTGEEVYEVWRVYGNPTIPVTETDPTVNMTSYLPEPGEGGSFLRYIYRPTKKAREKAIKNGADPKAWEQWLHANRVVNPATGKPLFEALEVNGNPGMHSTDTIDYAIVVSGEIWLELDDGKEVHLKQGDVVIQNGTKHAWRNHGESDSLMCFCMVGVANKYRQHFQDR
jgi:quercetin dioxygenase-like cupin family protein